MSRIPAVRNSAKPISVPSKVWSTKKFKNPSPLFMGRQASHAKEKYKIRQDYFPWNNWSLYIKKILLFKMFNIMWPEQICFLSEKAMNLFVSKMLW